MMYTIYWKDRETGECDSAPEPVHQSDLRTTLSLMAENHPQRVFCPVPELGPVLKGEQQCM